MEYVLFIPLPVRLLQILQQERRCYQLVNVDIGFCGRVDSVMNTIIL